MLMAVISSFWGKFDVEGIFLEYFRIICRKWSTPLPDLFTKCMKQSENIEKFAAKISYSQNTMDIKLRLLDKVINSKKEMDIVLVA